MNNLSDDETRAMLRELYPEGHEELSPNDQAAILTRIQHEHCPVVSEGHSLHCWHQDYIIDGQKYQVLGTFSSDAPPNVFKVVTNIW